MIGSRQMFSSWSLRQKLNFGTFEIHVRTDSKAASDGLRK